MIKGSTNKGDWSEFYVLLYLIATRRLYAADINLNKAATFYFPIIKILRDEKINKRTVDHIEYQISNDGVDIYVNSTLTKRIMRQEVQNEITKLRVDISSGKGNKITIPHGEAFLNYIFWTAFNFKFVMINHYIYKH